MRRCRSSRTRVAAGHNRAQLRRIPVVAAVLAVVALGVGCSDGNAAAPGSSSSSTSSAAGASTAAAPSPASTPAAPSSSAPTSGPAAESAVAKRAVHVIDELTDGLGRRGVSVAARDLGTGATFSTGATSGMYEGSIAKIDILETLMLQHQAQHTALSVHERDLASAMIERSDNDAANSLWTSEGGRTAVAAANAKLGLRHTKLGPGIYWGFSTTSAPDQLALLAALVAGHGALDAQSQHYILGLMRKVEADQRWGVATLADRPATAALKNGWLPNSLDGGRWLVNSLGIVRRDGHTLLVAVLTQHGASFTGGISRDEKIARAVLPALR